MALYLSVAGAAVLLLVGASWWLVRSSRAKAASPEDLEAHVSLAARILDNRGTAEVRLPGLQGAFLIDTRTYPQRPKSFAVRASSGYLGRAAVEKISAHLEARELQHLRRMTRHTHLVRDVRMLWQADDDDAPAEAVRTLGTYCEALGVPFRGPFVLVYRGRRDPAYVRQEGDPRSPLDDPVRRAVASLRSLLFHGFGKSR